jgi:hypothetical protein
LQNCEDVSLDLPVTKVQLFQQKEVNSQRRVGEGETQKSKRNIPGWGERERVGGVKEGVGEWGRNDPNIVCTYE